MLGPDPALTPAMKSCASWPEQTREASNERLDKCQQGSLPAAWSSVLGLALLLAFDPVRLALILLLISRPRPVQNLLAYWVTCLTVCVASLLVPLMVLHFTPRLRSFAQDLATPATVASSTLRHIQIGSGVLMLSMAVLITMRALRRARRRAQLPTPGGSTVTMVLDSNTPTAISRLLGRAQDAPTEG
jgi:hypothetical protein